MADVYRAEVRTRSDYDPPYATLAAAEQARTIALNRVCWGAVLAGATVALVAHLILNMLGVGLGAATLDPGTDDNPSAASLGIGAAIWFAVAGILAALLGRVAAGRLAGVPRYSTAGWHGLASWAVTTLIVFLLLSTTLETIVGGTFRAMTATISGVTERAAQVAGPMVAQVDDPFFHRAVDSRHQRR